ncbi:hypothetical protein WH8501_10795 [Crocosphaera watsonii WH 8501]|uniref:Uncharacterized protein n=6 Tax=Crocosphaera watsonii TaxID=263511 RepID=Q4BYI4_CROWT|nr:MULTISPECIES: hypothetical protein [Crocosphaera]EAM48964.1 hypothetical protein CwatDRAFT_1934 [Crocosphaera watsonii WH 8501]EHJ10660.1 hypothetical protein CWATWH0003_4553 [Crocosphaera watsonii WH 0003]MCH2244432.1 hypothetical protein [Crocosphaera sp.]NQZ62485.1 hypothetical protein [Crocosphaera sp.]CCQ52008.1 hypothetical protein CWATWH8502_1116 [Crocosphaera watsonii WH 8502]
MNNKNDKSEKPLISAEELDRIFDEGEEDILEYLDFSKARRPGLYLSKISENYQETIQSSKKNKLITSITMALLIASCILAISTFLDSDLDSEVYD